MPVTSLLLVLALVLRVGVVVATPDYRPTWDAKNYDQLARSVVATGRFAKPPDGPPNVGRPPGYPAFLAGVYAVTRPSLRAVPPSAVAARWRDARLAGAFVGVLVVALIGLIARRLWGPRTGLVALGLAALYAPLSFIAGSMLAEGLFVALELGAVACVLVARDAERRLAWLAGAGVLAGLAALTHDEGLVLLVPLALAAWQAMRSWRAVAVVAAGLALAVAPWTSRNAAVTGALVPVSAHGGTTLAGVFNAEAHHPAGGGLAVWLRPEDVRSLAGVTRAHPPGPARDRAYAHAAWTYARDHPGYVAEVVGVHTLRMLGLSFGVSQQDLPMSRGTPLSRSMIGVWWLVPYLLLALLGARRAEVRAVPRWVWLVPLVLWAATVPFSGGVRFRAPLDPFLVLAAAPVVAGWLSADLRRRWPGRLLRRSPARAG